ncbi:MAG: alanine:cation symporter family protein [Sandaracinaceae bacterium]|nr:alanine:cation symporter family protein [Sandaracinaceae bacterium]
MGAPSEAPPAEEPEPSALDRLDQAFGTYVVTPIGAVLMFDLIFWDNDDPRLHDLPGAIQWLAQGALADSDHQGTALPLIVLWLVLGAIYFTLRMGFINLRGFKLAVEITRGKYDDEQDEGEVTHFQALSSALSATVGLGNIAGVAIAVSAGGPGAVFWMIVAGFLGMSSKFVECSLGQMYRTVDDKGRVLGGPMRYLREGLGGLGWPRLGKGLAIVFALMCIGGSFGGGNMFQANQAFAQTARVLPFFEGKSLLFGLIIAALVGAVIVGGIKRIGQVAGAIVPVMCLIYIVAGIVILGANASAIPEALGKIFQEAFTPRAGLGGMLGVLVTGFRRAAFSNEAGIGSASIAHSAAATKEPIREGLVSLLEPFIDTIVICTMTGLVVVVTGEYLHDFQGADSTARGVLMTSAAFESVIPWFPYVLAIAVFLFAFSTMISWSYYGERCWVFLFGDGASLVYRIVFLGFVVLGSVLNVGSVIDFSDFMVLGMAFPNILGLVMLTPLVRQKLDDYMLRHSKGDFEVGDA